MILQRPIILTGTVFRFFKDQYPEKKTAIFSTWLDNRTKLVGDKLAQTGSIPVDYHFDGLELDTLQFPHDNESRYIHLIDEAVVNRADLLSATKHLILPGCTLNIQMIWATVMAIVKNV